MEWVLRVAAVGIGLLCLTSGLAAKAQVSLFGELGGTRLTNLDGSTTIYGPTVGGTADAVHLGKHMSLGGDLRGTFAGGARRLDDISIGPRFAIGPTVYKLKPYAEILVGFARYNNGLAQKACSTTDAELGLIFGVDRAIARQVDWRVFEYTYRQYFALGGQFNPKSFSTRIVLHIR